MSLATPEQLQSIQPDSHVWVMASAGSGKTHVLSERVLRLLLEGERPEAILCLTFTKAAAAEMSNRVFKRLADMVHKSDDELTRELADIGVGADRLLHARSLFARTLDARGGLKIQTIHAFCQSLLARFPLEAELPPGFGTLDDLTALLWQREALEAEMQLVQSDTALRQDWALLAGLQQDGKLLAEINDYARALDKSDAADLTLRDGLLPRLRAALDLPREGSSKQWFEAQLAAGAVDEALLQQIVAAWSKTPTKTLAKRLDAVAAWRSGDRFAHFATLHRALSTAEGAPLAERSVSEGKSAQHDPDIYEKYLRFHFQLDQLNTGLTLFQLADESAAMARICWGMVRRLRQQKADQGLISFDDLIRKAQILMQNPLAQWVLYKMDDRIRHILVDESQDTNSTQWRIIDAIALEFFVGEGAAKAGRTIFAVGDDKQSIFGFQGSEPQLFSQKRIEYKSLADAAQMAFSEVPLSLSFRSSAAVIGFVNQTMQHVGTTLLGLAAPPELHRAHRRDEIGSVTLWQAQESIEAETLIADVAEDLLAPWRPAAEQLLAFQIADQIEAWLSGAEPLAVHDRLQGERAVTAGDILILVQKRSALMTTLVSTLKAKGIAVAGVDRIGLLDQLVVKDVLSVVQFVLLPEDDLNLAALLKSPFIGLDEAQLLTLCADRGPASLWSRLRASDDPACQAAHGWLDDQLNRADQMPPFTFLSRLLDAPTGRVRLLAALGDEVADPLNMLMDRALLYEKENIASLQGFLHWLSLQSDDIKRDVDATRGQVRLMTVHGAKGLEAPVVIVADSCAQPAGQRSIIDVGGMPIWFRNTANKVGPVADALAIHQQREREEYWRKYYVAITRAADHLFITGWRAKKSRSGDTPWYDVALQSLVDMGAEPMADTRWQQSWRVGRSNYDVPGARAVAPKSAPYVTRIQPAPLEPAPGRPLSPSKLGDTLPRVARHFERAAKQRGAALHRLLEFLPDVSEEARPAAATRLLQRTPFDAETQTQLADQVLALLRHPDFAPLFSSAALAEAPVSALLPDGTVLAGQIDRLLIRDDAILIVDYKSDHHLPTEPAAVPTAYLRQMAAYRWALQRIWTRPVRAALLWTDIPQLMPLPDALLDVYQPAPQRS